MEQLDWVCIHGIRDRRPCLCAWDRYLVTGSSVAGFPFLASIIAIFSGAQLFALGMIGEYLARMHFRLMEKPTYAIRDRTGGPSRDDPS